MVQTVRIVFILIKFGEDEDIAAVLFKLSKKCIGEYFTTMFDFDCYFCVISTICLDPGVISLDT